MQSLDLELEQLIKTYGPKPVVDLSLCKINTRPVGFVIVINDEGQVTEFLRCDLKAYVACTGVRDMWH